MQPWRLETGVPGAVQPHSLTASGQHPTPPTHSTVFKGRVLSPLPRGTPNPNQLVLVLCAPQKQVSQVLSRVQHHWPARAYLLKEGMGVSGPHTGLGVSAALTLVAWLTLLGN